MVGKPVELIGHALPASASHAITTATSKASNLEFTRLLRFPAGFAAPFYLLLMCHVVRCRARCCVRPRGNDVFNPVATQLAVPGVHVRERGFRQTASPARTLCYDALN
jgi:hypothetical protein